MQRNLAVVDGVGMTPPREVRKRRMYFVTARAVNRCFRFVPTPEVCELLWYCLAASMNKFAGRIEVHEFLFMSNHYHLLLTDTAGCLPRLMRDMNSLIARTLNSLRGSGGSCIEKGYNAVRTISATRAVQHCAYALANPCEANLVARCGSWKGVSSLELDYGAPITVQRPDLGIWSQKRGHAKRAASRRSTRAAHAGKSKLPDKVGPALVRPKIMLHLSDAELRQHIREQLAQRELELDDKREREGKTLLGWDRVIAQHYMDTPQRSEELFGRVPSFAADNKWARIEAAQRRASFLDAYYKALRKFCSGVRDVIFPEGTWLMKERFKVRCHPLPAT